MARHEAPNPENWQGRASDARLYLHEGVELDTDDVEVALALELVMRMSGSADEAVAYLVWLVERTRTMLLSHWGLVEYFAEELLEHRTVRSREVQALIDLHL